MHVRLHEEPERHVWAADVGTAALPWLEDHQVHNVAALPGAAYCEMALIAAATTVGEACEVRDIRFEQMLLLEDSTPVGATASISSPGVLDFVVETDRDGERARQASARLCQAADEGQPPARDMDALLAAHPTRIEGSELRSAYDLSGIQYGTAFSGLAATWTGDGHR